MNEFELPDEYERLPRIWRATDLDAPKPVSWLAKDRIPAGATTILVGDEGIGKSLMWVWLVAAVTTGSALPEYGVPSRNPADVVLVLTEDDWSTTVRPRLEVARADLSRVMVICTDKDGSGAPTFPRDIGVLEDTTARLVIVDAWLDTVPSRLNVRDPQHARQALHPWKELATRTGAAIMLLAHTNRIASGSARDKYGATIELRKKARMTLYAQQDDDGCLVVGPEKSNLTRITVASKFAITSVQFFEATDDSDGTVPELCYVGDADGTAGDLVSEKHDAEHGSDHGSRDEAVEFLTSFLSDDEQPAEAIIKAAEKVGISKRTLDRAKKRAGVKSRKSGFTGSWVWALEPKDATKIAKVAKESDVSQGGNLGNLGGDLGNVGAVEIGQKWSETEDGFLRRCRSCGSQLGTVDTGEICGYCEVAS